MNPNEQVTGAQTNSGLARQFHTWAQGRVGRFLLTQLAHTAITVAVLAALLVSAVQVGALNSVLASVAAPAVDASFTTINYQGRLADSGGMPISDLLTMQFSFYDSDSGGTLLWGPETHPSVPVTDGLFSVRLGSQPSPGGIPANVFGGGDVWLETIVEGETLSPREKLTAVPYAIQAGTALTVADGSITTGKIVDGTITQSDAPFAPLTYWYFVDNTPDSNMKVAVSAHVFDLAGANSKNIDISAYGFTSRPLGICEIADTSATVQSYFCAYSWDDSDANTAHLRFYRYDGGSTGPSGNLRITLFLMGK